MNYREWSRKNWGAECGPEADGSYALNKEQLTLGCMLRIADSMEKLAQSRHQLEQDAKYWRERSESLLAQVKKLESENKGLEISKSRYRNQRDRAREEAALLREALANRPGSETPDQE